MNQEFSFYKQYIHFVIIALLVFLCYSNSLQNSWHFDDISNIIENENIHFDSFSSDELRKLFYSSDGGKISRPVANLTFAVNYLISGFDTTSYHIVNILIHIFSSCVAYLIFLQTLRLSASKKLHSLPELSWYDIALLGSILWALHPIQVQAVTYIVQRMASLAALFYLAAFCCYLRFRMAKKWFDKALSFLFAIIFFLLALNTKENSILLPLALIGYEVAFFRTSLWLKSGKAWYLLILPFAIVALIFVGYYDYHSSVMNFYSGRVFTLWERLLTQPLVLSRYLLLIFYPNAELLMLDTDIVASKGIFNPPVTIVALLFISSLLVFSIANIKKYPFLCFAVFFYFANHLVESTFLPLELYFEHRNYLPSIFIFMAISYYICIYINYLYTYNKVFLRNLISISVVVFLVGEGNATLLRNDVFYDELSLHSDTIDKAPLNIRPYIAIAVHHMKNKRYDEALEFLRKAERIHKNHPGRFQDNWVALIYYNAGMIYRNKMDEDKAINFFAKDIELDPTEWQGHLNLGIIFFNKEDYVNAENFLYNAVLLHKNCPADVYNYFGRALYANGKYGEAIETFKKGLAIKDMSVLHYNLAATYMQVGSIQQAKSEIFSVPYEDSKGEGTYYLFRAALFPGEERKKSLKKISSILLANNDNFCEWVSNIKKNNSINVIFPDLTSFEEQLNDTYLDGLSRIRDQISKQIKESEACTVDDDLQGGRG